MSSISEVINAMDNYESNEKYKSAEKAVARKIISCKLTEGNKSTTSRNKFIETFVNFLVKVCISRNRTVNYKTLNTKSNLYKQLLNQDSQLSPVHMPDKIKGTLGIKKNNLVPTIDPNLFKGSLIMETL